MSPLLLMLFWAASGGDTTPSNILACRPLAAPSERLACYDRAVDALAAKVDANARFGRESRANAEIREQVAPASADSISGRLVSRTETASGRMVLGLDNGQTWIQADSDRLALEPGDAVVIRRASLGSYLLEKGSGSRAIRVKRVD